MGADLPFAWRGRLAQDGALLGNLTRIFVETAHTFYAERAARDGHPCAKTGSVTVVQRTSPDSAKPPLGPRRAARQAAARRTGRAGCFAFRRSVTRRRDQGAKATGETMTISWLGNSSVATLPTLLDLVSKGKMEGHAIHQGRILVFASVGAGMHINAAVYRVP